MATNGSSLLDSGIILAAITACLYAVGTAEYGGYLGELGLDANVLDRNFHQVVYRGFFLSLAPAMTLVLWASLTSVAYVSIAFFLRYQFL